jgi:hypothetical protein
MRKILLIGIVFGLMSTAGCNDQPSGPVTGDGFPSH